MELSTVIFDIGGVVLNWVPERAFEQVMPADEVPGFMKRIGFDGWNRANDALASIEGSEDELVARFPADAARIRGYRQHFLRTVTEMVPGTPAVIAELGQAGVRLGALTNWAADMFALARPRFGVLTRFGDIVVSGTEGVVKPDPEIYRLACERLGIHPGEAVFIDDSPANVHAADEFGLHGLHFTSAAQLREDLVGLGLLADRAPVAEPLFHWTLRSRWAEATASGGFPWSTRDTDYNAEGFVHCSFADQVDGTRRRFYGDVPNAKLVLLKLDPDPDLPIVVEDGYPHLFAPLPVDRVAAVQRP
jgi:2-haloacid dehalogenase